MPARGWRRQCGTTPARHRRYCWPFRHQTGCAPKSPRGVAKTILASRRERPTRAWCYDCAIIRLCQVASRLERGSALTANLCNNVNAVAFINAHRKDCQQTVDELDVPVENVLGRQPRRASTAAAVLLASSTTTSRCTRRLRFRLVRKHRSATPESRSRSSRRFSRVRNRSQPGMATPSKAGKSRWRFPRRW